MTSHQPLLTLMRVSVCYKAAQLYELETREHWYRYKLEYGMSLNRFPFREGVRREGAYCSEYLWMIIEAAVIDERVQLRDPAFEVWGFVASSPSTTYFRFLLAVSSAKDSTWPWYTYRFISAQGSKGRRAGQAEKLRFPDPLVVPASAWPV